MKTSTPIQIQESNLKGEQIIFDILIKQKLAHVIVIKDGGQYHINLDGEDLGSFKRENDGSIERFAQPKGAHTDDEHYFKPIIAKLNELKK
ncbi:MAG: hypothetical protein V4663_15470 [Bacteroidota bacterium]